MSEEKAVSFGTFSADEKKAAMTFGGGLGFVLYQGAGFAILNIADKFGYNCEIEPLDAKQQKELAEASARALAYLIGEMVSNPVLACIAVLGMAIQANAKFTKKPEVPKEEEETEAKETTPATEAIEKKKRIVVVNPGNTEPRI